MSEPGNPENEQLSDISIHGKNLSGERTWKKKSECPALTGLLTTGVGK